VWQVLDALIMRDAEHGTHNLNALQAMLAGRRLRCHNLRSRQIRELMLMHAAHLA
jgi:hypothetical protein